jgi:tRNA pseudouridine13 synthase
MSADKAVLSLPRAWAAPAARGLIRARNEDFRVEEVLDFAPSGDGEHVWLHVRKDGANTQYVADAIAAWAGVGSRDVGYAGLKDRHAISDQWFSVYMPGKATPSWRALEHLDHCSLQILMATRHRKKLIKGAHAGNRFQLRVSGLEIDSQPRLTETLQQIMHHGVPNAFGPQRFGIDGGNISAAEAWFGGGRRPRNRQQRGLILSAARSWLFNLVLAERIRAGSWRHCLVGEWSTQTRAGESVPTGPLFGRGKSYAQGLAGAIEAQVSTAHADWITALCNAGLSLNRRRLCSRPRQFTWQFNDQHSALDISFYLPRGEYATSVLDACIELRDVAQTRA